MAGSTRTRAPVKTGAHRDIEGQIGASKSKEHPDLDPLPPGWKSRQQQAQEEDAQDDARDQAMRSEYRAQARARTRAQNRPPAQPRRAPSRQSSRSGAPRARRTKRPTLADPTGGRLPFLSFDGEGIAGVFFGAIFYALVLSVADYGPTGPALWFKAKFLNQPAGKGL